MSSPHAHNINNWHWTEKYFNEWAIPRIKELLTFKSETPEHTLEVTADSVKGDVFKYVRKNKISVSYDVQCKLNFKYAQPEKEAVEGTVSFEPFVDEGEDDWDFEVKITNREACGADSQAGAVREVTRAVFVPRFRTFLDELERAE